MRWRWRNDADGTTPNSLHVKARREEERGIDGIDAVANTRAGAPLELGEQNQHGESYDADGGEV